MKFYPFVNYIYIIWFISILFIAYFGFSTIPHTDSLNTDFIKSFANWDGGHYLAIAQNGYKEKFQFAFFPLYPLIINLVNKLFNNYLFSSILISLASFFLGLQLLYQIVLQ